MIKRIAVAFEVGRDGFWLARWLRARDIEVHVIHTSSVAASREHGRAKTDRLDTEMLKRAFLAGCAAITASWSRSRQLWTKIANGSTASARALSESKVGSSTKSKQHWSGSASAASIPS